MTSPVFAYFNQAIYFHMITYITLHTCTPYGPQVRCQATFEKPSVRPKAMSHHNSWHCCDLGCQASGDVCWEPCAWHVFGLYQRASINLLIFHDLFLVQPLLFGPKSSDFQSHLYGSYQKYPNVQGFQVFVIIA